MSELDFLVPPEIINDSLFNILLELAARPLVKTILEIGSSSGEGSTKALYQGIEKKKSARIFCIEVSKVRFSKLLENYKGNNRIVGINMSTVFPIEFPSEKDIQYFYMTVQSALSDFPMDRILGWLKKDIDYIQDNQISCGAIREIKKMYKLKEFDLVLIDGSEFTGFIELKQVLGSKLIVLDDIKSFKNYHSYNHLLKSLEYKLLCEDRGLRNGFAVFERIE